MKARLLALVFPVTAWLVACGAPALQPTAGSAVPSAGSGAASTVAKASTAPDSGESASRPALNPAVHVRLGVQQTTVEAALHDAIDKGFFRGEGLEVEEIPARTATDALPQLAGNNLDLSTAPPDPALFNAVNRGVEVKLLAYLAIGAQDAKGLGILVRKDLIDSGRYKEPKDLKGMTVALNNPQGTSGYWMEEALATGGLTLKDISTQTLPYPDMNLAMTNKSLDIMMNTQPYMLQAENQGLAKTIFVAGQLNFGGPSNTLLLAPGFASSQPEAAKRFMVAFVRGQRDLFNIFQNGAGGQAAKDEVYQQETKHTAIKDVNPVKVLTSIAGAFSGIPINGEMPLGRMQAYQDFFLRSGAQQAPIDFTKLVDRSYVDYAVQQLGGQLSNPNLPQPPASSYAPKPEPV